ncbi:hypothetical protein BDN71DRAFT_1541436 [Pleurotus eryngii]|uniref:Uncharacterized protein n=1 Tax=Pleurotus eryngii TaxID=5323 RepID=A0A9P5ZZX6_PLEER|nr:hypothetical protein BDN71DRAFT_1541436 [Pleurotus eryngii]
MSKSSALLSFAFTRSWLPLSQFMAVFRLMMNLLYLFDRCLTAVKPRLVRIVTNQNTANCPNPSALTPIALNGGNASIVQPADNWSTSLCPQASCSNLFQLNASNCRPQHRSRLLCRISQLRARFQ